MKERKKYSKEQKQVQVKNQKLEDLKDKTGRNEVEN